MSHCFQRLAYFNSHPERFFERQRRIAQAFSERFAVQMLHYQEVDAVLMPDVMQGAYAGMIDRRIERASRSKRCFRSALEERYCGRTLIATVRSSRVSGAR